MDVGFISEFTNGNRVFRFSDGEVPGLPIVVGDSAPLEKSFCHYVARGLMPQLLHDAIEDPVAANLSVTQDIPVGAHLSVPLRHPDGTPYGTLCCFSFSPDRSLTQRDLGVLRLCADVVGSVLKKDRHVTLDIQARRERVSGVLATRAITMLFQPLYRVADRELTGFEALARFPTDPERPVEAWFDDAAQVGLGHALEFLAIEKALELLPRIDPALKLTVNLSPSAVMSEQFAAVFAGAPLGRIVVELTEHAVVESYTALRSALASFRARGLRLAIDDVGAGHATFRHVLDLAPEMIKLDRSLILGIDADSARRALAEALTSYGRRIGCEVVAEGVETAAEFAVLEEIGVTRVQGFLTGRPMSGDAAERLPLRAPPH